MATAQKLQYRGKKIVVLAGIAFLLSVVGWLCVSSLYSKYIKGSREWTQIPFHRELWLNGTTDDRGAMVMDLFGGGDIRHITPSDRNLLTEHSRLYALNKSQVEELLGPPDRTTEDGNGWWYGLGTASGNPDSIDYKGLGGNFYTLAIEFNEHGTAVAARIMGGSFDYGWRRTGTSK